AGGKVLQELRIGLRRDEREFTVTLRGPAVHVMGAKLPQVVSDGVDEVLYDRMFLYTELTMVIAALYRTFAAERVSDAWDTTTLPALERWVAGEA
ncbi:MAG: hypothetical protein KC656_04630, partial [Myxococcales bacterium]|nr:hypothetical protein [Myxococcales bacterium]